MENMEQTATNTSHNESGISPLGISHISASGNTITLKCSACGSEMSLGREYFTMIKGGGLYKAAKDIHCAGCDAMIHKYSLIPRHQEQRKSSKVPVGGIIITVLLVLGTIGALSPFFDSQSSTDDRSIDAWICAQNAVSELLKSPSTADFPSYSDSYVEYIGDNEFRISAYVDAENEFGATVRQNFTVVLTLTESGYTDVTVNFS